MKTALLALASLLALNSAHAETFVHNFDMNGDSSEFLHEATNVRIVDERPSFDIRYWRTQNGGQEGIVTYGYSFDQPIESASFYATIGTISSGDAIALEVSSDDLNYTTLLSAQQIGSGIPNRIWNQPADEFSNAPGFDVTGMLAGSTTAFVRARFTGNSQYLRTAGANNPNDPSIRLLAPRLYQFSATTIPEPSALAIAGIATILMAPCRR